MKSLTEAVLHVALRGLSLRQQIIADNVANAETPGFKAREVRFEEQLRRALGRSVAANALTERVKPAIASPADRVGRMDQNSVDVDQQLLAMTETGMRYQAVARALAERLALYRTILNDGRG